MSVNEAGMQWMVERQSVSVDPERVPLLRMQNMEIQLTPRMQTHV
jgi:hypothetical protein